MSSDRFGGRRYGKLVVTHNGKHVGAKLEFMGNPQNVFGNVQCGLKKWLNGSYLGGSRPPDPPLRGPRPPNGASSARFPFGKKQGPPKSRNYCFLILPYSSHFFKLLWTLRIPASGGRRFAQEKKSSPSLFLRWLFNQLAFFEKAFLIKQLFWEGSFN